eukprot:TRINITY_DN6557_c0_g1_i1.p1 TRINITY_DN6557_c0_g1~~TRINITY_DN6557_c0_g1_i1.p1  ORF type:complete len:270 (-),score=61.70 TRINITY_DN6557_c0_g1_i1:69-788(-)
MAAEELFFSVPPVTRAYGLGCAATTLASVLNLVSPFQLFLYFPLVFGHNHEVWRLVTNFFFVDQKLSLNFFFHMYFVIRHSMALEEQFAGRTADFAWLWMFGAAMLLLIDFGLFSFQLTRQWTLPFLGPSLSFMVVYIWSRRNKHVRMSFLGLFTFTAPYLPWVLIGFGFLLNQDPTYDILGVVVGHLYYYLEDVLPRSVGIRPLRTPFFLKLLLDRRAPVGPAPAPAPAAPAPAAPVM